ncbi:MAG: LuxR C-terminal-related transcriptional regulator [Burkholderiaceae bacterium]
MPRKHGGLLRAGWAVFAGLLGMLVTLAGPDVLAAEYRVGIAFVPTPTDSAEEKLNKAVGRDPHIDFVFHVRNPIDMFRVIAERLAISPRTVQTHRNNIAEKLGVRGVNRLLELAIRYRASFG